MLLVSKKLVTIGIAILLLVSLALTGCGNEGTTQSTNNKNKPSDDNTNDSVANSKDGDSGGKVHIVLPLGASGEEEFYQEQAVKFMEENPDIELKVTFVPDYGQAINLMFASGEAPDIIRMNGSLPTKMTTSYSKGWIQPLDQFVRDDFKERFPPDSFSPGGRLYMDGQIYGIPLADPREPGFRPFYYNINVLKEFGFDGPPETWAELKEMAMKITQNGDGKVYGYSPSSGPHIDALTLYETANGRYQDGHLTEGNFIYDTQTGMSAANNPPLVDAVEFLHSMKTGKIFVPGWESTDGRMHMQQFASGKIAMFIGQFWYAREIYLLNPDINMGIANIPIPDSGREGYKTIYGVSEPYYGITSESKNPKAAWRTIEFFSTMEFHQGFHNATKLPTVLWEGYEELDPITGRLMEASVKELRVGPYPGSNNPAGDELLSGVMANAPKPDIKELITAAIVGDKDFEQLAQEYDDKMNNIIDEQIAIIKEAGGDISKDILKAPEDWNPLEDYIR